MFDVDKFDAAGNYTKTKSRYVARGDQEFGTKIDISAPTCSLQTVFMIAAIAAKENRHVASADIPGAYLHTKMTEILHIRIEPKISDILVKLKPELSKIRDSKGYLYAELNKALYGCDESARLWYDTLSAFLINDLKFKVNPVEPCIFNLGDGDDQVTVCVYVDDLMVTSLNKPAMTEVLEKITAKFPGTNPSIGNVHSYLGMLFDFSSPGKCKITMEYYIRKILNEFQITGKKTVPADLDLFTIDESSPLLPSDRKARFRSLVASLLYLVKRVRPEALLAVSFCTTRVNSPTEQDDKKLQRIAEYFNFDFTSGIILEPGSDSIENSLVSGTDAAFGIHPDGKSHSGLYIGLGDGPVYVGSKKQKIVSKSSTEAELISLTDGCSQIIWSRDFLIGQGYSMGPALVYQDNMSTMSMVKAGKPTSDRTRHIHVRYFFVKDRVSSGELLIEHMPTDELIADLLTKPLFGNKFRKLKAKLLNWVM